MIPLFFVYYFEYAINSGISATLVFDGWGSDKVYKYYGLMYQIGTHTYPSSPAHAAHIARTDIYSRTRTRTARRMEETHMLA
jgi:hypothetical protein